MKTEKILTLFYDKKIPLSQLLRKGRERIWLVLQGDIGAQRMTQQPHDLQLVQCIA